MKLAPALLEQWLRDYYFEAKFDIGSSGVENFSLGELRERLHISQRELDGVVFCDSPTLGDSKLREAIAKRWATGRVERVMTAHGSSEAIYLILNSLLHKDDEVVVLDPIYYAFAAFVEGIGCRVVRWPIRFEEGFTPDVDDLNRLVSPRTKMIIVNFPHNPTGATATVQQQNAMIRIASKAGCYLLWDSAFGALTYEQPSLPEIGDYYDRAISIGTLSKAYGLPGLRVGWGIAPPEVLQKCTHLRDYTTLYLSPLIELIATRAIQNAERLVSMRLEQARANREILTQWVNEHEDVVRWVRPAGGVSCFLRLSGVRDVPEMCRSLAREAGVLLVPGNCVGFPQFVRLGFGGPTRDLESALTLFSKHLHDQIRPAYIGS